MVTSEGGENTTTPEGRSPQAWRQFAWFGAAGGAQVLAIDPGKVAYFTGGVFGASGNEPFTPSNVCVGMTAFLLSQPKPATRQAKNAKHTRRRITAEYS
jgi:hypothetical protein